MRHDDVFLADIVAAADSIAAFLAGQDEATFTENDMLRSAVLQKLTIIGEAAARVSPELKSRNSSIPWRDIAGFRNIAIHHYFGIDWHIVWNAATLDAPALGEEVQKLIDPTQQGGAP